MSGCMSGLRVVTIMRKGHVLLALCVAAVALFWLAARATATVAALAVVGGVWVAVTAAGRMVRG